MNTTVQYIFNCIGDPTILCIIGSRLIIHLKDAAERCVNEGTSYQPGSLSVMDFELTSHHTTIGE